MQNSIQKLVRNSAECCLMWHTFKLYLKKSCIQKHFKQLIKDSFIHFLKQLFISYFRFFLNIGSPPCHTSHPSPSPTLNSGRNVLPSIPIRSSPMVRGMGMVNSDLVSQQVCLSKIVHLPMSCVTDL